MPGLDKLVVICCLGKGAFGMAACRLVPLGVEPDPLVVSVSFAGPSCATVVSVNSKNAEPLLSRIANGGLGIGLQAEGMAGFLGCI